LGDDVTLIRDVGGFLKERGIAVEIVATPADGAGLDIARLAMCYVPDPAAAGGVLHAASSLRTVLWPPLVIITGRPPSKIELERFRRQGAVHVTQAVDHTTIGVLRRLLETDAAEQRVITRDGLASHMATMEKAKSSGLLVVRCSHWSGLSVYPWENSSLFYCSAHDAERCHGWAGRVYVVGGAVHHVETPSARGHHALAQMLALADGAILQFPFFVLPEVVGQLGTVADCLAKAAIENEHTVPRAEAFPQPRSSAPSRPSPTQPPPVPARPQPASQPLESTMSSDLDPLLASASLSGAIRIGPDARVLAASGTLDAEGTAAVATVGLSLAEQVAAVLPLGVVIGACAGGRGTALYMRRSKRALVVARGSSAQTPTLRVLRDIARY
jgi:hypothetical protein